jgi:hypothetical protein
MVYLKANVELRVVQGWFANCVANAHKNRIMPHWIRMVFEGNAWLTCSALGLSPFGQAEKGCFQLHNQA